MSASNKKQLRKEQQIEMLTARQQQEQAEAKKLKIYTITFIVIMALVAVIAIASLVIGEVNKSGVFEKGTVAATVNGQELNSVQMSYYYNDAISEMYETAYNQYSSYYELFFESMGLDIHKPLNEQVQDEETGATWADYFVNAALESAKHDYTMAKMAEDAGFALPETESATVDTMMSNLSTNAMLYGYSNADTYLRMVYGAGANTESYKAYLTRTALADAYYQDYYDGLTYTDDQKAEYTKDKPFNYNSYNFNYVYLSYTDFQEGGTEDENGNTTYTDEENAAARAAAKKAAEELGAVATLDDLRDKVSAMEGVSATVNDMNNTLYTSITKVMADWLTAEERKSGDIGVLENVSTAEEGEEPVVNGYYIVYFDSYSDNTELMDDVRHLLVQFEGGEEDEISGEMVYTEEEKNAAKAEADKLLQQWKDGDATEESFIALVKEHSDDTSAEDGGLFEDIHPGSNYVPNFLSWAINPDRKAGDAEVIETEYGYHVMYYVGNSEMSYRDHLVTGEMKTADQEAWLEAAMETATASTADLSRIKLDLVISPA